MKITNGHQQYLRAIQNNHKAPAGNQSKPIEKTTKEEYVSVEISDEAKKLSATNQEAAPSERAAAIKKAIQAGTYQVSAEKVADGMLEAMTAQKKVEEE